MNLSSDDEVDDIRQRKLNELRRQLSEEQQRVEHKRVFESQKENALRQILTYDARQRLNRIKLVKPEFADQLELQLIQLAQTGRTNLPIDDGQLKKILIQLQSNRKEITFRRI